MSFDPDKIASVCYEHYEKSISSKSKPAKNEWTNLAAIVASS